MLSEYNRIIIVGKLCSERYVKAHVWSDELIYRYRRLMSIWKQHD